eukprot:TRINITY_DN37425_c0_g1_i1.p1 TRINITY_DN37425_c0_g1~~TRINITY_DN37425_c0_g1_i1.p1  ORF type:complete len:466 (-),score=87.88 TRINITY_DN37425_c0_g1_i1:68-1465(-)
MAVVEKAKARGIAFYRRKEFANADTCFTSALSAADLTQLERAHFLANRAAVRLEWCHYGDAALDCAAGLELLAELKRAAEPPCNELVDDPIQTLMQRLETRAAKVATKLDDAKRAESDASLASADPDFNPAERIRAFDHALMCADRGDCPSAKNSRARLLCSRSEAFARVGDFPSALKDAQESLREEPGNQVAAANKARFEAVLARLGKPGGQATKSANGEAAVATTRVEHVLVSREAGIEVDLVQPFIAGTGGRTWEASHVLAHWLVQGAGAKVAMPLCNRPGGRLLELGAGLGLVGLAAAVAGASDVVLSDIDSEVLDNLRREKDLNGLSVQVASLDYTLPVGEQLTAAGIRCSADESVSDFDVVVGADIIYAGERHAQLAHALPDLMRRPNGLAVLCFANNRVGIEEFVELCIARGFDAVVSPVSEAELAAMRRDTENDDLCSERGHSLLLVRWRDGISDSA